MNRIFLGVLLALATLTAQADALSGPSVYLTYEKNGTPMFTAYAISDSSVRVESNKPLPPYAHPAVKRTAKAARHAGHKGMAAKIKEAKLKQ